MKNTILLLKNGEVVELSVPSNTNVDEFKDITYFQTKGSGKLQQLHYWTIFDETIIIYGWTNGEAGDENKHELPEPIDNSLYFGDIIIFCLDQDGHLRDFNKPQYDNFINHMMGGFIDLEEEEGDNMDDDNENDNSEDDDDDYIPPSESESDEDFSEDELSEDGETSNKELQEEPEDRDILVWGDRKEVNTSSDEDSDCLDEVAS